MDVDVACVLCGGPFDLEQHVYGIDPDKPEFQWLYNVRLLGTPSSLRGSRLSTEGEHHTNKAGSGDIFLSESIRWRLTDADCFRLDDSFYRVLVHDDIDEILVPLHHACIEIACRALNPDPLTESGICEAALSMLYDRLHRLYHQRLEQVGCVQDLLDLNTSAPATNTHGVLALDKLGWWSGAYEKYLNDPLSVPNLTAGVCQSLSPVQPHIPMHGAVDTQRVDSQIGLASLPRELFDCITDHLPLVSILSLRQCSRTIAINVPLDDRFWRRNLCSGSILPYVWGLDEYDMLASLRNLPLDQQCDWPCLMATLRRKQCLTSPTDALSSLPAGYWNRCRIWTIVCNAGSMLDGQGTYHKGSRDALEKIKPKRSQPWLDGSSYIYLWYTVLALTMLWDTRSQLWTFCHLVMKMLSSPG